MSHNLQITDGDIHAYLLGAGVSRTIESLRQDLMVSMPSGIGWNGAGIMEERARRSGAGDWHQQVYDAFAVCPHHLAERFLEAALLYRLIGSALLPELLPLAQVMLETDLHAYFTPRPKPYRDHLAHQTRVAALAHLLLDPELPLPPWVQAIEHLLKRWTSSAEHHLLAEHLGRLGLAEGMPTGRRPLRSCLQAACLLAGLVHDLGYAIGVEAWLGGPETALDRLGIFPEGSYDDPPATPLTQLYRTFYRKTGPGHAHASIRSYVNAHPNSPHSLAGALWLAYLPERLQRDGLLAPPEMTGPVSRVSQVARGRFELICQLAAMMVLAHDLPVDSASKQAEQGFKMPQLADGASLFDHYPGCTLFALADLLHAFGRPVLATSSDAVMVRSPVLALQLVWPDEWTLDKLSGDNRDLRRKANQRCRKFGLPAEDEQPARLEIFWVIDDSRGQRARVSKFDAARLGEDVPDRLAAWGLDRLLCQRDVSKVRTEELRRAEVSLTARGGLWLRRSVAPGPGKVAIHPLSRQLDDERGLRDSLHLRPLK